MTCLAISYILIFGVNYVSWPRLIPLTDAIDYDGPGARSSKRGRGVGSLVKPGVKAKDERLSNGFVREAKPPVTASEAEKGKHKRLA